MAEIDKQGDRMTEINSYPLHWPAGWDRTASSKRKRAQFGKSKQSQHGSWKTKEQLTVAEGIKRVLATLQRMDVPSDQVIISTNMPVRQDGLPYSGRKGPDDPGAAVYWRPCDSSQNTPHKCMAIDQYDRLADNLAAIAGTLDAMRAIERWGGADILDRAFQGFAALPEYVSRGWHNVLGVAADAPREEVERAYKILRGKHHPDRGGDTDIFQLVQEAWKQYLEAHGNDR